jgi:hypothetical protein
MGRDTVPHCGGNGGAVVVVKKRVDLLDLLLLCRRYVFARYACLIHYRSYFEPLLGVGFGRGERNNSPIGS